MSENAFDTDEDGITRRGRLRCNPVFLICVTSCLVFWALVVVGGLLLL
jgi:hypothetical protein